jgi:hypothetical protein
MTSCRLVICYRRFGGACHLHLQHNEKVNCRENWLHYIVKEWVRLCRAISGKECRMKQWEVGANVEMQKESKVTNGNKNKN